MDMQEGDQTIEVTVIFTRQEIEELERAAREKESDIERLAIRIVQTWLEQVYKLYQKV